MTLIQVLTENRNKVISALKFQFENYSVDMSTLMNDFVKYLNNEEWTAEELVNTINFPKSFDQLVSCFSDETAYPVNMKSISEFQEEQIKKQMFAAGF